MSPSSINNYDIVDTFQLLMTSNDVATISLNFKGWILKLNVTFVNEDVDHTSIRINSTSYSPEFEYPVIRFINWNKFSFSGMNTDKKQLLVGTHDNGENLYLRAFVVHSEDYYNLTLQFLAEPINNTKTAAGE